jgi:hypothetical protein
MPVRFPFKGIPLAPGHPLLPYWGPIAYIRPAFDLYLVGPTGSVTRVLAQVDSASDYVALDPMMAQNLGLQLPFPRQTVVSGAGGHNLHLTFPPDGMVSLFITDYTEFYYLPDPLVGFHSPPPGAPRPAAYRSVLGFTGFLQHFKTLLDPDPSPPVVELTHRAGFTGQHGPLPRTIPLLDFIQSLKLHP